MLSLRVTSGPCAGAEFTLNASDENASIEQTGDAAGEAFVTASLGRPAQGGPFIKFPLPLDTSVAERHGEFIVRTIGGPDGAWVAEYRNFVAPPPYSNYPYPYHSVVYASEAAAAATAGGRLLDKPIDTRVMLRAGSVVCVGDPSLVVTGTPALTKKRATAPPIPSIYGDANVPQQEEVRTDRLAGARDPDNRIDPIWVFIRLAENGYASDIQAVASLSRDPELWSYLARSPRGDEEFPTTWLHAAAALGHTDRISFLVGVGASLEAPATNFDDTPLHTAARSGQAASLAALSEHGAVVDAFNYCECTPLHRAAESCSLQCTRLLLEAGADASLLCQGNEDGWTSSALVHACYYLEKLPPVKRSNVRRTVWPRLLLGERDRRQVADLLLCYDASLENSDFLDRISSDSSMCGILYGLLTNQDGPRAERSAWIRLVVRHGAVQAWKSSYPPLLHFFLMNAGTKLAGRSYEDSPTISRNNNDSSVEDLRSLLDGGADANAVMGTQDPGEGLATPLWHVNNDSACGTLLAQYGGR